MLGVFAAVAALCGALAPWAVLPFVAGVCWWCYDGFVAHHEGALGWLPGADLRPLALISAFTLLGRLLSGPVERALDHHGVAARHAAELNPLFRDDDRRRARLRRSRTRLLATALGLGLAVGIAVQAQSGVTAAAARAHGHPVTATTLANAEPRDARTAPRAQSSPVVSVPARWDYPLGTPHTGQVVVFRHQAAGTRLTVWVDDAGRAAAVPPSEPDRVVFSLLSGLSAAALAALLALVACGLLVARLDRRAARAWAVDWARVEPHWSGRSRDEDLSDEDLSGGH